MKINQLVSTFKLAVIVVGTIYGISIATAPADAQEGKAKAAAPKIKLTAKDANKIALKKFPGKVEGKTPLENEEGHWQYGVMVRSGKTLREVMVDANTGKIANVEVTTDKKEAKEKADEAKMKKTTKPEKDDDEKDEKSESKSKPVKKKG